MKIRPVIVISISSLAVGYSLAIVQQRSGRPDSVAASVTESSEDPSASVISVYELLDVQVNRDDLDGRTITVVGGVQVRAGRPFLVPDDDIALSKEFAEGGRYLLSLPDWRFRSLQGIAPRIAVTGRFGKLDDVLGFDCLSPINSVSWEPAPRGPQRDSTIDAEELRTIEAEHDEASLLLEFTPAASKVLDPPFEGSIRVVWPKGEVEAEPERVRLNFMKPADGGKGHSPIATPYLATTEDGASYWGAFALRPKLPDTGKLTSFSSYEGIVELLGAPTHLPLGGETDDKWACDSVSWRLFSPSDPDSLEVLEVSVARKFLLEGGRTDKYLIESCSVSRGFLSKGDQAGAGQPAPASSAKPEDKQKPQPGSGPASR